MSKLQSQKSGELIKTSSGFPLFLGNKRKQKVITSNVWAFLKEECKNEPREHARKMRAFIEQAYDFYLSASNPRLSSRPLLYYYAFLNLVKAFLLFKGVNLSEHPNHGVKPKGEAKQRLRFVGQEITISKTKTDHSRILPEFLNQFNYNMNVEKSFRVIDLLSQIPAIHRTYCLSQKRGRNPVFCPIKKVELLRNKSSVWARVSIERNDSDVKKTLYYTRHNKIFLRIFTQVKSVQKDCNDIYIFETTAENFKGGKSLDKAISRLAKKIKDCGIWGIITSNGYKYYFINTPVKKRMPQLCSVYAIMFYLGSITRYRPYDFDKISEGYSWLISDFIDTAPEQFLYLIASIIAETEVVSPHALQVKI